MLSSNCYSVTLLMSEMQFGIQASHNSLQQSLCTGQNRIQCFVFSMLSTLEGITFFYDGPVYCWSNSLLVLGFSSLHDAFWKRGENRFQFWLNKDSLHIFVKAVFFLTRESRTFMRALHGERTRNRRLKTTFWTIVLINSPVPLFPIRCVTRAGALSAKRLAWMCPLLELILWKGSAHVVELA